MANRPGRHGEEPNERHTQTCLRFDSSRPTIRRRNRQARLDPDIGFSAVTLPRSKPNGFRDDSTREPSSGLAV